MAHEKTTCPSCGGMGIVGSVCEYCGSVIQLSTPILEKGLSKMGKKTISGEQYAEKISKYQKVGEYHGKLAIVSIGQRFGLIDRNGDLALNLDYDDISCVADAEGLFAVLRFRKGWALFNDSCKFVSDFQYHIITDICLGVGGRFYKIYNPKGLNYVERDNKWGVINSDGIEILPCIYDMPKQHSLGKYGFVQGLFYENGVHLYDEYIKVEKDEKYGVFDVEGHEIIPCIHSSVYACEENKQYVVTGTQLYDIESRQEVLPHIYGICSNTSHTFPNAIVQKEGKKRGIYNINTKMEVLPCIYDTIIVEHNWVIVGIDGKKGLFTLMGKNILSCVYAEISIEYNRIKVGVKSGNKNKWGVFKLTGEAIIPCRYDKIEYDGENKLRLFYDNQTKHVLQIELDGDKVVKGDAPHLSFVTLSLIFFLFFLFSFLVSLRIIIG